MTLDSLKTHFEKEVTRSLWGQAHQITPRVLDEVFGNGKQLVGITFFYGPFARPNYIVVRVDSGWNVFDDDRFKEGQPDFRDHLDEIFEAMECQFDELNNNEQDDSMPDWGCMWFPLEPPD